MADEATVSASLRVNSGSLSYSSEPSSYSADVTGVKGPSPGAIGVATTPGTDVDLTELTTPGLCVLQNLDDTNYVTYGIWDVSTATFFPLGELLPGEVNMLRLARSIDATDTLRFVADTASCNVVVSAFEA